MDVYSSQPYCISFFYLQIKPFYMLKCSEGMRV